MSGQRCQVVGIVLHVVTVAHLSGAAMAAAVMSYDAIAMIEEKQHLRVPVVGRKRPTMAEHDGLTSAPVFIENLNAVLCRDRAHRGRPFLEGISGFRFEGAVRADQPPLEVTSRSQDLVIIGLRGS